MIHLFLSSPVEDLSNGFISTYEQFFEYGKVVLFTIASGGLIASAIKSLR